MRELEKIKRERAEQKAREEAEQARQAEEQREEHIALGNPLLNPKAFNVKRRWDDDVVFKNQARGTEQKGNKEFVNVRPTVDFFDLWGRMLTIMQDLLRSDFHKKFMVSICRWQNLFHVADLVVSRNMYDDIVGQEPPWRAITPCPIKRFRWTSGA